MRKPSYTNLLLFLWVSGGIFEDSEIVSDVAFRVSRLSGLRFTLACYFWRRAQKTLEIQNSGLAVGDDNIIFYFNFSD
jgi:hypothetical protein